MKNNFCPVPFKELYFEEPGGGKYASCCQMEKKSNTESVFSDDFFKNDNHLNNIRKQFLKNQRPTECNKCWEIEDRGMDSYRKTFGTNRYNNDTALELNLLDIRLSNKCNLQCKMCGPEFSDQIAKNSADFGLETKPYWFMQNDKEILNNAIDVICSTNSVNKIKLAGGEPFIMKEVLYFLEQLIKHKKNTSVELFIISNMTTINSKTLHLIQQFSKNEISCSIDGVGKWIEYQRFPARWDIIDKNFRKLSNTSNVKATLTPCISQLNLHGIPDFIQWADSTEHNWLAHNDVIYPSCLSYELIPLKYRKGLKDKIYNALKNTNRPKRISPGWFRFIDQVESTEREITKEERINLRKLSDLWNYNNNIKYNDFCPWANELLGAI